MIICLLLNERHLRRVSMETKTGWHYTASPFYTPYAEGIIMSLVLPVESSATAGYRRSGLGAGKYGSRACRLS